MCGIVLAGGNLVTRDVELFGRLLYADIVRGEHSTGVFAGFRPYGHDPILKLRKAAVPADMFLRRKDLWGEVREHAVPSKTVANSFTTAYPKFMVGHNRYATQGAINDTNAHPFNHGHITLVHNGTLTDQSLLPDHKRFAVDSENVAWSIAKIGIDETIQKLNGAFTLVWHNAEDSTVNIIRNEERPFHLVETTGGDWFGASEEDMLMWLVNRKKFGPTVKRHFECEVGVQYVFDVSEGFKFKEERKHTLPVFRTTYSYSGRTGGYWYDQWDDDYGYGNGRRTSTTSRNQSNSTSISSSASSVTPDSRYKQFNDMLESHGLDVKMGEQLRFESFQFDQYPKSLEKGKMTGYTGTGEYIEVQAHGTDMAIFREGAQYDGKIISCYEQNYILTIIVQDPKLAEPDLTITLGDLVNSATKETSIPEADMTQEELNEHYGDDEDDDGDEVDVSLNGDVYSKKEWERNDSLNTCANCSSPIPFDDIIDTVVDNGASFCNDCAKHYNLIPADKQEPNNTLTNRFVCQRCTNEFHEDLESCLPGVCIPCLTSQNQQSNKDMAEQARQELINKYDRWESNLMPEEVVTPLLPKPTEVLGEITAIRKKLKNNLLVTVKQWMQMNTCGWCKLPIQWVDAEATDFIGQQPCCPGCSKKLDMGVLPKPINKDK